MLTGDRSTRCNRLNVVSQCFTAFGDLAMFRPDALKTLRELGLPLPHRGVENILLGVMHGIRVGRHVAHDVVNQLVVGTLPVPNVVDLPTQQVQHDRHVAMIFAQIVEQVCQHYGHLPSSLRWAFIDRA